MQRNVRGARVLLCPTKLGLDCVDINTDILDLGVNKLDRSSRTEHWPTQPVVEYRKKFAQHFLYQGPL